MNPSRTARWRVVAPLAVAITLALAGPAHAAVGGDPYGSTTTTAGEPTLEVGCELTLTVGPPGTAVTAVILNVTFGDTIRVLFGGTEVGRATAPQADESTAQVTSLTIDFVVPQVAAGRYLVTAVGGTFTGECSPEAGLFDVLAATQSRGDGSGALPRTGVYAALLVALALALVVAGRAALAESRRRRRRAARLDAQHHVVGSRRP